MKFAFNTFPFSSFPTFLPTYSLQDTIKILAGIGYDAVEIGCCAPHAWPAHLSKGRRAEIRALAEGEGIAISSLLPAIGGGFGCNPCSVLRAERLATVAHYIEIVDLAHDLGAKMALFIGGWRAEGMSLEEGWAHSRDCLRAVANHAAERGITVAIEPTTADTNLIDTAADARRMMVEAECANVGLMFDTCHVAYEGRQLSSYVIDMGADLIHLHAADTGRKAIGHGDTDWDDLIRALVEANYQGYFTVETGFGSRHINPVEVARHSLLHIKSKLSLTSSACISAL
ncbi:protein FrlC [Rhizobium sp. RU20A]|uniref:sugar phosphate isomerase/epimerase family protein n=1 Tax=Rhizobium sp. RU20A TaxID=1907412 RepID=UPI000954AF17|nr:sugar phosphate isomerase/epimerase family protein [Rhizobium sp. RU20A]SIR23837.1 protein FrlC [Rhizobium sp. RU20A]